jgi:transposase
MATLIKKKIKNKYYYYAVEIKRINGKPKYTNQIYLGTIDKIIEMSKTSKVGIPTPLYSQVLELGPIAAIYDIANRLNVVRLINSCVSKRTQGVTIGEYMLIAAINRAVSPKSKLKIGEWFLSTILAKLMDIDKKALTCQRFWDNMNLITDRDIRQFEDVFVKKIVDTYRLNTSCLIYDATNFFTYLDTKNDSKLAKRGHSKEKRNDLKIIGLSMMISPEQNVPLFYECYPGNRPDTKEFEKIIKRLKNRYRNIIGQNVDVTVIFDRGNNSEDNIKLLLSGEPSLHFVGGLKLSQCQELLDVPKSDYAALRGTGFKKATAYRTTKTVFKKKFTVVIVNNPELFNGQMQSLNINIQKSIEKLSELKRQLNDRANRVIVKGRKPTKESVEKKIANILSSEYMIEIFDINISVVNGHIALEYQVNNSKLAQIQERFLGKTILFTNRHEWSNEEIVSAYRSAWHIEHSFRQMKNPEHLAVRPIRHWTDQKINVHIFYCVLAFRLCCLLKKELEQKGIDLSIDETLYKLSEIKQVISIYDVSNKKANMVYSLTKGSDLAQKIFEGLNLEKYQLVR